MDTNSINSFEAKVMAAISAEHQKAYAELDFFMSHSNLSIAEMEELYRQLHNQLDGYLNIYLRFFTYLREFQSEPR